jgi:hypothetical protein
VEEKKKEEKRDGKEIGEFDNFWGGLKDM